MSTVEGNKSLQMAIQAIQREAAYNAVQQLHKAGMLKPSYYVDRSDDGLALIKGYRDSTIRLVVDGTPEA